MISPRRPWLQKVLISLIQAGVLAFLGYYLYQNRESFVLVTRITWQTIAWVFALETLSYMLDALQNFLMIRKITPGVSFVECLGLQYVNSALNKILPTIGAGAAFRAYYLKRVHQFPYTQFTATLAGLYVIRFISISLIGITCMVMIYAQSSLFNGALFAAFCGLLMISLGVVFFTPQIPASSNRMLDALRRLVEGWHLIKQDSVGLVIYTLLSILLYSISAGMMAAGYRAIAVQANFLEMLLLSSLGILLTLFNFTPDGIGVKEGVFIFASGLVQIPGNLLVIGSLILRGISIIPTAAIAGISYLLMMRKVDSAPPLK